VTHMVGAGVGGGAVVSSHTTRKTITAFTVETGSVWLVFNITDTRQSLVTVGVVITGHFLHTLITDALIPSRAVVTINTAWFTEIDVSVTVKTISVGCWHVTDTIVATAHTIPRAVAINMVAVAAIYITFVPGGAILIRLALVCVADSVVADLLAQPHKKEQN